MENIYDRIDALGEFTPQPDDDRIICRCEEVTKGVYHNRDSKIFAMRHGTLSGTDVCETGKRNCSQRARRITGGIGTSHIQSTHETSGDENFCKGR